MMAVLTSSQRERDEAAIRELLEREGLVVSDVFWNGDFEIAVIDAGNEATYGLRARVISRLRKSLREEGFELYAIDSKHRHAPTLQILRKN